MIEMIESTPVLNSFLSVAVCLLAAGILLCLILALRGPRFTDRIVALNVICTLVILLICILSFLLEASYLLDVAILYGLLNLLAIVLLSRLTVTRRKARKEDRS